MTDIRRHCETVHIQTTVWKQYGIDISRTILCARFYGGIVAVTLFLGPYFLPSGLVHLEHGPNPL